MDTADDVGILKIILIEEEEGDDVLLWLNLIIVERHDQHQPAVRHETSNNNHNIFQTINQPQRVNTI